MGSVQSTHHLAGVDLETSRAGEVILLRDGMAMLPKVRTSAVMGRKQALPLVLATALLSGCSGIGNVTHRPEIRLSSPGQLPRVISISGLNEGALRDIEGLNEEARGLVLQVNVADASKGAPALIGEVQRRGKELVFQPRYPFEPGVKYRVSFQNPGPQGVEVMEFKIPAPRRDPVVRVAAIYPSGDELPANLLKFYIHFSGPMNRGEAYSRIHLLDEAGKVVEKPFLELGEELWNPEMTRFTLFFDPGRIKQGLVPRMELGAPLEEGKTYTLVIDAAWTDGENRPLVEPVRKTFRVGKTDSLQPNPLRWKITAPRAGTKGELVVAFEEPLDHAMLERVLTVRDAGGGKLAGKVRIGVGEREWGFVPDVAWQSGRHTIAVETILEDRSGNSIGRPFEVDLNQANTRPGPDVVEIPFVIGPAAN